MAHLDNATTSQQIQQFLNKNGGIAVVDCFATWCGPCKAIAPYVHQMHKTTGIPLITINVDQAPELSEAYQISAMPTFIVIKGQWKNMIEKVVGGGKPNVNKIFEKAQSSK